MAFCLLLVKIKKGLSPEPHLGATSGKNWYRSGEERLLIQHYKVHDILLIKIAVSRNTGSYFLLG